MFGKVLDEQFLGILTTGKTIALIRWTFVSKGISLVLKTSLLHSGHHRALSRVPCALQYGLISYLFYT